MSLFDPGLQPERTELAWRRTALALGAGSLVAMRLLPLVLGHAAWAFAGVAGLAGSVVLWALARHRYRRTTRALLQHGERAALHGGGLLALLAAFVVVIAVTALTVVVVAARSAGGF